MHDKKAWPHCEAITQPKPDRNCCGTRSCFGESETVVLTETLQRAHMVTLCSRVCRFDSAEQSVGRCGSSQDVALALGLLSWKKPRGQ